MSPMSHSDPRPRRAAGRARARGLYWLAGVGALVLAGAPAGAAKIQLASSAAWAPDAQVPEKVRAECAFESRLASAVAERSTDVELVTGQTSRAQGRVLELSIHEVHAPGGGAFSGPKWATVRGELYESGKLIGSFRDRRYTTGGVWGSFQGTCTMLGRIANAMGQDIAAFLTSPRMDAQLGDAR
jgi:hypothetical protein